MALRLDGKALSAQLEQRLHALIEAHHESVGRPPGLALLRVGEDPASGVYVSNKEKACARVGVVSTGVHLASTTPAADVLNAAAFQSGSAGGRDSAAASPAGWVG